MLENVRSDDMGSIPPSTSIERAIFDVGSALSEPRLKVRVKTTLIGKLVSKPDLKERAKTVLMNIACFDDYPFGSYCYLREVAWQQLKPLINDPDVHDLFTKISEEDGRVPYRFKMLNYLDNIDDYKKKLHVEIAKRVIGSFDLDNLSYEAGRELDYALWLNDVSAFKALCEFGESTFAQKILAQFTKTNVLPATNVEGSCELNSLGDSSALDTQSAPLYSILKFIGVHTADQTIFNSIVTNLIKKCDKQKLVKKCDRLQLDTLESLPEVLVHLNNNQSVHMPVHDVDTRGVYLFDDERPHAAFYRLPSDCLALAYEQKGINALVTIIEDDAIDPQLRKFAIRDSAQYFFTEHAYGWVKLRYKKYAQKIGKTLKELTHKESTPEDVKKAAAHLLEMDMHINGKYINVAS